MSSVSPRSYQSEQLDNLELDGPVLTETLKELAFINRLFGSTRAILSGIRKLMEGASEQTWRIVDLGCGGGDILMEVAAWFQRKQLSATFIGIDGNPASIEHARTIAQAMPDITWQTEDILDPDFCIPPCDIVISSHFLYHLKEEQLTAFLEQQSIHCTRGWVISELIRNKWAPFGFHIVCRTLGFSNLTRQDGILAIERAMKLSEWRKILNRANRKFSIKKKWIFRQQIIIDLR